MGKKFGVAAVAGLGVMMAGKLSSNPQMVATYAFGGHIEGSATYPTRSMIPQDCVIVGGSGNKELAEEIAHLLGCKLANIETGKFKDGETFVKFEGSVEGKHVMLICSQSAPANDTVFETLLLISSLKRNGASSVSLYLPYSAYARQDKMVGPWRSLAYSDLAHYYEAAGVDRVITLDIHNEAVMGCYSGKINATNLTAVKRAAKYISRDAKLNNLVVLSPDEGGVKRAKKFYEEYLAQPDDVNKDSSFSIMVKSRVKPGEVGSITVNDDFTGKACILIDDMIGTGGTMIKAAEVLKSKGATDIYVFATHGIFSGEFYQKVQESDITKVFVTNNLKSPAEDLEKDSKVQRIPISKLFADHIYKTCMGSP